MFKKGGFKVCPGCHHVWITRDDMLYDPTVSLLGYQVHFLDFKRGLFYFNHNQPDCKSTFTISVNELEDVYEGPRYTTNKMADDDCPLYCLRRTEMDNCKQPCEGQFVREIIEIINKIHQDVLQSVHTAVG